MDASKRKSVNLDLKQRIKEDISMRLRESLFEELLDYFNNLKISSDDPFVLYLNVICREDFCSGASDSSRVSWRQ